MTGGPPRDGALRWGLLSTAAITQALMGSGRGEFVAVASRSPERARAFAARHGVPRWHGSYEDLLADPGVDAVYVPLPNAMHVEWSIRALEAGKHVLCEKPMSRHPEDVERAFAVAERRGLVLAEGLMWRHHEQIAVARALVADGAIGRLRMLRASFGFVAEDPADIRLQGPLDGGALMDVGCYCVSGLRALAGTEPERVGAELVRGAGDVDVAVAATLRFPGDVLATLDCGVAHAEHERLEATGDAGTLVLEDPWPGGGSAIVLRRRDGATERIETTRADPFALELGDFEAAVRGERAPLLGRADALGQARTIAALYRAAEEGRPADPARA